MSLVWRRALSLVAGAMLVAGCGGSVVSPAPVGSLPTKSVAIPSAAPATTAIATSNAPAGQIVFVDDPGGVPREIYIEHADGSNARRLVASPEDNVLPSFSPDGSTVVFTRLDPTFAQPDRIFVVNVDGSGLRQLEPAGCPGRCGDAVEGHAWSPDGTRIVFTRAIFSGDAGTPLTETDQPYNIGLWVMNADGSGAHQVTLKGLHCADGACTGAANGLGEQHDEAGWSPDGTRIVFLRDLYTSPEQYGIFTVAADGTDLQRVTPEGMNVGDPDWSPDGQLIVFQSPPEANSGGEQNIFTIHPDGSGQTQLTSHLSSTSGGLQGTFHASWSPDGSQIAFSHSPSTNGRGDIFVMDRDGSGLHLLSPSLFNENGLFWGPLPRN